MIVVLVLFFSVCIAGIIVFFVWRQKRQQQQIAHQPDAGGVSLELRNSIRTSVDMESLKFLHGITVEKKIGTGHFGEVYRYQAFD